MPMALVLQTYVEHHDFFREVLLMLFKLVTAQKNNSKEDRFMAFAELLSHVSFLGTIPGPTFNTRFNIELLGRTLTLTEPDYDEIPDRNQIAITTLFKVLDLRSIILCWKAIILQKTLILVSDQYQL